jgi:hypothetical protein
MGYVPKQCHLIIHSFVISGSWLGREPDRRPKMLLYLETYRKLLEQLHIYNKKLTLDILSRTYPKMDVCGL